MNAILFLSGDEAYALEIGEHACCGNHLHSLERDEAVQQMSLGVKQAHQPEPHGSCALFLRNRQDPMMVN